jgi:hypothetical protein
MSAERLRTFLDEEYAYYNAIASTDPAHITPMDVLVTVSVNSFVNDAAKVRRVASRPSRRVRSASGRYTYRR